MHRNVKKGLGIIFFKVSGTKKGLITFWVIKLLMGMLKTPSKPLSRMSLGARVNKNMWVMFLTSIL